MGLKFGVLYIYIYSGLLKLIVDLSVQGHTLNTKNIRFTQIPFKTSCNFYTLKVKASSFILKKVHNGEAC